MNPSDNLATEEIREQILKLTREYSRRTHGQNRPAYDASAPKFVPGETNIPYAGRVFTEDEVEAGVGSMLDFWLTLGKEGEKFENSLADFLDVRRSLLVNSGSSANLVALSALTSHKLPAEKRICPGDEIITVAAGFPTTVAPIIQCGATAVFIDADPVTGNAKCEQLEDAYVPGKTKAVMMAHALGNPFDLSTTLQFCRDYDLWLIEDNCDALGCSYTLSADSSLLPQYPKAERNEDGSLTKYTGSFGDLSTQSFYPPHHLTLGEGGAVNIVGQAALKVLVESFRDWGRDCWCPSGKDNTCNKRFGWQLGELPEGYDHKYIYSHLGYNLKPLDPQAAIGSEQLKKLPEFIEARKRNWQTLRSGLAGLEEYIEFSLPTHATGWNSDGSFSWDSTGNRSDCSWFGFKMSVRENAPFTRTDLARFLDEKKIGNRMLFGGNLLRQPAFVQLRKDNPGAIRVVGEMTGADEIMNQTVFTGTYPGLTEEMLGYIVDSIIEFANEVTTGSTVANA
ncbi:lipopolysaccharide biosynthesis protein RfbH [Crateriforma spongiae]|uniref:lipopolysaccharide biosynthesis protein RfbH n=1 Tax=Crateriforma spongiae TaxID=2724528 RepID=UPI0014466604|nr:lipopolysaccharide biosynthesis protein RfbH [Crateriforma spongiae]